jgi:hypothetical protein
MLRQLTRSCDFHGWAEGGHEVKIPTEVTSRKLKSQTKVDQEVKMLTEAAQSRSKLRRHLVRSWRLCFFSQEVKATVPIKVDQQIKTQIKEVKTKLTL